MSISKKIIIFVTQINQLAMPNTKCSELRYKVIDRCLRRGGYSTSELMKEINKELEFHGYLPITALNTIRQDMDHLISTYPDVEIVKTKHGRNVTYSYSDSDSTIFKLPFNDDELAQLTQCMAILSQFEGTPQMEWMQSFLERFKLSLNLDVSGKKVIGFDECRYLRGKQHFASLLSAVCNKKVILLTYNSFHTDGAKQIILHPYYIKQFNNRWYVLGREHGFSSISHLAFDRIESISVITGITFTPDEDIDFNNDYFSDIIGVTKHTDVDLQTIKLLCTRKLLPYIVTKPLHETQRITEHSDDTSVVEITVRPNYELEQLILSFGEGLTVLSPVYFRDKITQRVTQMSKNYE